MKDLYTFDYSTEEALKTYKDVREAYSEIFIKEMKLPMLVAEASSGDMGGDLSHEYHIPTELGEDQVMSCNTCDYVANEEVAQSRVADESEEVSPDEVNVWRGISKDRKTFVNVWYIPDGTSQLPINTHTVKQIVPDLDAGLEDAVHSWSTALESSVDHVKLVNFFDSRVPGRIRHDIHNSRRFVPTELKKYMGRISYAKHNRPNQQTNFLQIRDGDGCPRCTQGILRVQKAIELGHTFYLGTRYSEPMNAFVSGPKRFLLGSVNEPSSQAAGQPADTETSQATGTESMSPAISPNETTQVPIQMGCHGIGVSRIIGAVANHLADERGLNWPRVMAPYDVVVVFNSADEAIAADASTVYDALAGLVLDPTRGKQLNPEVDAVLDDRHELSMGWKLNDADLVGYPVLIVLGREWKTSGRVEVQCRRLGFKDVLNVEDLKRCVEDLLQRL